MNLFPNSSFFIFSLVLYEVLLLLSSELKKLLSSLSSLKKDEILKGKRFISDSSFNSMDEYLSKPKSLISSKVNILGKNEFKSSDFSSEFLIIEKSGRKPY